MNDFNENSSASSVRRHARKKRIHEVREILEKLCDRVFEIAATNSWKIRRQFYNIINYNITKQIKDLNGGRICCLAVSPDEEFTFVGHTYGMFVVENNSQQIKSSWQNKKQTEVTQICVHRYFSPTLLMVVDELGTGRLFFYNNSSFILIEEINQLTPSVFGLTRVTIYDSRIIEEKSLLILKYQQKRIHFIEFRRIPVNEWKDELISKTVFSDSILLCTIRESQLENYGDVNLIPEHESTLGKKFILDMCNKCYYPKAPSYAVFKLWPSLVLDSSENDYIGIVVWWTSDNNVYLYSVSVTTPVEIPTKCFTKWSHTDSISHCAVSPDSELIAVALQNGAVVVKRLNSGSIKYVIRLCSIGKIDGIWFIQTIREDELQIENSTPKSSKTNSTDLNVENDENFVDSAQKLSNEENQVFDDDDNFPTEPKVNLRMASKEFQSTSSLKFYLSTKTPKADNFKKGLHSDSDWDADLINTSHGIEPTVSVIATSTSSSKGVVFFDESNINNEVDSTVGSIEVKEDLVDELIRDFRSSFVETFRQPKPRLMFSLVVALSGGSLWQMSLDNSQQLKQLIATTNDNDGVVHVEHVGCKPEMIMTLTRQGRVYLIDIFNDDLVSDVKLPITHLILNPWDPIFQTTNYGKKIYIAGCKNVAQHSRKYDKGELFQIDLFPDVDEKFAEKIGKSVKNKFIESFEETTRSTTVVKFIPSLKHTEKKKMILSEIYDKFQQLQREKSV